MSRPSVFPGILGTHASGLLARELPSESVRRQVQIGRGTVVTLTDRYVAITRVGPLGGDRGHTVVAIDSIHGVHVEPSSSTHQAAVRLRHADRDGGISTTCLTLSSDGWASIDALMRAALGEQSDKIDDAPWSLHTDALAWKHPANAADGRADPPSSMASHATLDRFAYPATLDALYGRRQRRDGLGTYAPTWGIHYLQGIPAFDRRYRSAAASQGVTVDEVFRGVALIDRGQGLVVQGAVGPIHCHMSVHWHDDAVAGVEIRRDMRRGVRGCATTLRATEAPVPGLLTFALRFDDGVRFVDFTVRPDRFRHAATFLRQIYGERLHVVDGIKHPRPAAASAAAHATDRVASDDWRVRPDASPDATTAPPRGLPAR